MSETVKVPDAFSEIGSSEVWFTSMVEEAMEMLYQTTMEGELEEAISAGKMYATGEEQQQQIAMLTYFLRKEKSGNLKPPPSLKFLYRVVVQKLINQ